MDKLLKSIIGQPNVLTGNYKYYVNQIEGVYEEIQKDFDNKMPSILLTGMGASYFACQVFYNYLVSRGYNISLHESSELVYYQTENIPGNSLIIMVSQSGESIELKKMMGKIPESSKVLSLTNNEKSTVGKSSDYVINLDVQLDQGVAINTYVASVLALLLLAEKFTETSTGINKDVISEIAYSMERWIDNREEILEYIFNFLGEDRLDFITVGRGPSLSSVDEGALLFREVAKTPCLNISGGQLRHGSVEVVNKDTCVINFAPKGRTQKQAFAVTDELLDYGAKVILVSDGSFKKKHLNLLEISVSNKDEFLAPIYDALPCQLITYYLAKRKGIIPGTFINTVSVITSE